MNENEIERKLDTYKEVIDECLDDTSTIMMEDFVNKKLDYTKKTWIK